MKKGDRDQGVKYEFLSVEEYENADRRNEAVGAYNTLDLSGHKYNKLLVIKKAGYQRFINTKGHRKVRVIWECLCDCGTTTTVTTGAIRSGQSKSCGCFLVKSDAGLNNLLYVYKKHAKDRQLKFDLTKEQFSKIIVQNCYYCNLPPSSVHKNSSIHIIYNGVDRVNNECGYEIENCVPCCGTCNYAKGNKTKEVFLAWIKRVYETSVMEKAKCQAS